MEYQVTRQALIGQTQIIVDMIAPLTLDQWRQPSTLPGWDILTLVAHIGRATDGIISYAAQPLDSPAVYNWLGYFDFDGSTIAAAVSERAVQTAAQTSPATISVELQHNLQRAVDIMDKLGSHTVVKSRLGPISLGDFAVTRVVEITIHTLDLAASLGQSPRFDTQAQKLTIATLEGLAAQPRPAAYWDDLAFMQAATGRVPSSIRLPAFS